MLPFFSGDINMERKCFFAVCNIESLSEDLYEKFYSLCSQERKHKTDRFKFEKDRKLSVSAFVLLRYMLYKEYGFSDIPEFQYEEHKKPILENNQKIKFNFSHCKDTVACAVSDYCVGVDVQDIITEKELFDNILLAEEEKEAVKNSENPCSEFIRFWTLKESFVKNTGMGIGRKLVESDFSEYGLKFKAYEKFFLTKRFGNTWASCCSDIENIEYKIVTLEEILKSVENFK